MSPTQYHSTRSPAPLGPLSTAILAGLAPDGGLYVPEFWPQVTNEDLWAWQSLSYAELATEIFLRFSPDFEPSALKATIASAYNQAAFGTNNHPRLSQLRRGIHLLELWHGPTSAFKDYALQLLPSLFALALGGQQRYHILTATSGDTGGAALAGFKNQPGLSITVLYPATGTSAVQAAQMKQYAGTNCQVIPIAGDFDDCQRLVKGLFNDSKWGSDLAQDSLTLSSANSINWGRILAQMVYFVWAYLRLVQANRLQLGEHINVSVPSGNFGNILSAFYTKQMGLPLGQLLCATNSNCVLADFMHTGRYDIRARQLQKTLSPSMDILVASNIERLLYALTDDPVQTTKWMRDLQTEGVFELDSATLSLLKQHFLATRSSDAETLAVVGREWEASGQILDPHTACALNGIQQQGETTAQELTWLVVSTAHWSKFPRATAQALLPSSIEQDDFAALENLMQHFPDLALPNWLSPLRQRGDLTAEQTPIAPQLEGVRDTINRWLQVRPAPESAQF